jgi:hypothetical protein
MNAPNPYQVHKPIAHQQSVLKERTLQTTAAAFRTISSCPTTCWLQDRLHHTAKPREAEAAQDIAPDL